MLPSSQMPIPRYLELRMNVRTCSPLCLLNLTHVLTNIYRQDWPLSYRGASPSRAATVHAEAVCISTWMIRLIILGWRRRRGRGRCLWRRGSGSEIAVGYSAKLRSMAGLTHSTVSLLVRLSWSSKVNIRCPLERAGTQITSDPSHVLLVKNIWGEGGRHRNWGRGYFILWCLNSVVSSLLLFGTFHYNTRKPCDIYSQYRA